MKKFWEILNYLGRKTIHADVMISVKIFTPIATFFRDNLGTSQWTLATQSLIGSGVLAIVYYGIMFVIDSPWYGLIALFVVAWYMLLEYPRIKEYESKENGAMLAFIREHVGRMWFLGSLAGLATSNAIHPERFHLYDILGGAHIAGLVASFYFRTVIMPPPKPREDLKVAFA